MEKGVEAPMRDCTEKPTTRGSIKYDMSSNVTSQRMREEICDLMSMEEVNKPALRIVIPSGNDNFSFRSAPHATTANIIKNICKKNWKPVDNALFVHEELKDKLLHCLSKNMAHEMTGYIHSDSMLKYNNYTAKKGTNSGYKDVKYRKCSNKRQNSVSDSRRGR